MSHRRYLALLILVSSLAACDKTRSAAKEEDGHQHKAGEKHKPGDNHKHKPGENHSADEK